MCVPRPALTPDMLIARVDGVTTREAAEALNRVDLYLPRDRLPPPEEEDEFLLADLIGCLACDAAGTPSARWSTSPISAAATFSRSGAGPQRSAVATRVRAPTCRSPTPSCRRSILPPAGSPSRCRRISSRRRRPLPPTHPSDLAPRGRGVSFSATILTLYPEMFPGLLGASLSGDALSRGLWSLDVRNIRDHGIGRHRNVDDTPAGGGVGMVLRCDVLASAIDAAAPADDPRPRILMSPRGRPLTAGRVRDLAAGPEWSSSAAASRAWTSASSPGATWRKSPSATTSCRAARSPPWSSLDACVRLMPGVMGKEASGAGGKLRGQPPGVSPLHPPAGVGGPRHPRDPPGWKPCAHRALAARGGRGADPRPPAGPPVAPLSGPLRRRSRKVTSRPGRRTDPLPAMVPIGRSSARQGCRTPV